MLDSSPPAWQGPMVSLWKLQNGNEYLNKRALIAFILQENWIVLRSNPILAAEAHFTHPEIDEIQSKVFDYQCADRVQQQKKFTNWRGN